MRRKNLDIEIEMLDYIKDNEIYYIADFWDYAEKERADDWFPVLRSRETYKFMKFYFNELRGAARRAKKKVPPPKNSWHKDIPEEGENENG